MDIGFMYRLRKALSDKGITRTELSRISGVAKGDITHYLKGDYVPKQDKCYLLAKALGVDPGWLMTGYEPPDMDEIEKSIEEVPKTVEARTFAKGIDKMPEHQRKAILDMMMRLYPGVFEEGTEDEE